MPPTKLLSNLSKAELIGNTAGTYINLPTRTQDASGLHRRERRVQPAWAAATGRPETKGK